MQQHAQIPAVPLVSGKIVVQLPGIDENPLSLLHPHQLSVHVIIHAAGQNQAELQVVVPMPQGRIVGKVGEISLTKVRGKMGGIIRKLLRPVAFHRELHKIALPSFERLL